MKNIKKLNLATRIASCYRNLSEVIKDYSARLPDLKSSLEAARNLVVITEKSINENNENNEFMNKIAACFIIMNAVNEWKKISESMIDLRKSVHMMDISYIVDKMNFNIKFEEILDECKND